MAEGKTFLPIATAKFESIDPLNELDTLKFLDACQHICAVFDILGTSGLGFVKSDIEGNIKKLRKSFDVNPAEHSTLQALLRVDITNGHTKKSNSATESLMWLMRALQFIEQFLERLSKGQPEKLKDCCNEAYECTLSKHHGWMARKLFGTAMMFLPYKEDFFSKLGGDAATVCPALTSFLVVFTPVLKVVVDFYDQHDLHF
eukprot:GCRY01000452.1.p1 GENE.GCRY01000452.1~~GCRY01000452.1.p1  ORF type:complete len:202 (+),score=39.23 GCRY01000452.1:1225-1830(+)